MKSVLAPVVFAALASTTPSPFQGAVQKTTTIVIRHDPNLIRLDGKLVSILLTDALRRKARERVSEDETISLSAGITDIREGQPQGVFVGDLIVSLPKRKQADAEKFTDAVIEELQRALTDRLTRGPVARTEHLYHVVEHELEQTMADLASLQKQLDAAPTRELELLRNESVELERTSRRLEMELAAEEVGLHVLEKQHDTARREYEEQAMLRQVHGDRLASLEAKLDSLDAEVKRALEQKKYDESLDIAKKVREVGAEVEHARSDQQRAAARSEQLVQEVGALDTQIQAARVTTEKLRQQADQIRKQRTSLPDRIAALEQSVSKVSSYAQKIRQLEARLGTLVTRKQELRLALQSVQPVQIQKWK